MPAPLIFIVTPLLVAPCVYAMRRWPIASALTAAGTAALLGLAALLIPLNAASGWITNSFTVLGRTFVAEPGNRLILTLIFFQAAILFAGAGLQRLERYFLTAGLAALGVLSAALFVRPFLYAAIFLELVAALAVFMLGDSAHLGGEPRPATRGALRFLVYTTLALPLILFTGWFLDQSLGSPDEARYLQFATYSLAMGFAILLAVVPFHGWLPMAAEHSPPLASAFVASVFQFTAVAMILNTLNAYTWLAQNPQVYRWFTLAGMGMVAVGALLAFGQRNLGRVMGYALMIDTGAVLLALGLGTRAGAEVVLSTLVLRGLALPLWGLGLDCLRRAAPGGGNDFDALQGLAVRYPLAAAAIIIGLLSLVGFPLTAGFPARWALLRLLAETNILAALALVLAMVSVGLVCARGLVTLNTPWVEAETVTLGEGRVLGGVLSLGLVLMLLWGAFPQWLLPLITGGAQSVAGLSP